MWAQTGHPHEQQPATAWTCMQDGGNRSPWRKPTQAWRECTNSTQKGLFWRFFEQIYRAFVGCFWYAGRCNTSACRTLRVASVFAQTQLTVMILQFFQGSLHFSVTTKIQNTCDHGHILHVCVALCILCSASNHTRRLGFPVSQLHCRTCCCVSQIHIIVWNCEGAGLRLLSSMCKAGRGTLRSLHAEVLQWAGMLPEGRGWVTHTRTPRWFWELQTNNEWG